MSIVAGDWTVESSTKVIVTNEISGDRLIKRDGNVTSISKTCSVI